MTPSADTRPRASSEPDVSRAKPQDGGSNRSFAVRALLLVALVAVVFSPVFRAGFVWDDDGFVTPRALRHAGGLVSIWTDPDATQGYYPLLHTLFWIEARLFGDAPLGYHVVQLALHAGAALLVWRLASRLALPGAYALALLFAIHPVQTETAAWVAEQKNTLSACFYLAAWLAWLDWDEARARRERRAGRYALSIAFALAAACSKSVTLTLAPAILLATWWREGGRAWIARVPWLLPHLLPAIALGLVTAWREVHVGGAQGAAYELDLAQRVVIAGKDLWFYLGKLAWPAGTCFVYPRWEPSEFGAPDWIAPLGFIALLLGAWLARERIGRGVFAALAFFAGTLVPALGFFDVIPFAYSFVADHFQYLALLGPLALAAATWERWRARAASFALVFGALALTACALLAHLHARDFRDAPTLWRATLERNPSAWIAWENLLDLTNRDGRHEEALALAQEARTHVGARRGVELQAGIALQQRGELDAAVRAFDAALALDPSWAIAHANRGTALEALGRREEALAAFERAIELDPGLVLAHMFAGNALLALGRSAEALARYERALELDARSPRAWFNLGVARFSRGERPLALAAYERALELEPTLHDARFNRAVTLAVLGRTEEARAELERVARAAAGSPLEAQAREALRRLAATR